jgi:hypothetical protein
LRDFLLDQLIASYDTRPRHRTVNLDAVDDPAPGRRQLTYWHGHYGQNQCLPFVITCADNDQFVMLSLGPDNVHVTLGADDLTWVVTNGGETGSTWPSTSGGGGRPGVRLPAARVNPVYRDIRPPPSASVYP